jgi:multisubunit Na+/H+ antiporter MnhG subunit
MRLIIIVAVILLLASVGIHNIRARAALREAPIGTSRQLP